MNISTFLSAHWALIAGCAWWLYNYLVSKYLPQPSATSVVYKTVYGVLHFIAGNGPQIGDAFKQVYALYKQSQAGQKALAVFMALTLAAFSMPIQGCSLSQVETTTNDITAKLPLLVSMASAVDALVDPGDAQLLSEISAASGKITADVNSAEAILAGFSDVSKIDSGSLARINAAIADGQAQIASIEQLVGIKNPALQAEITAWATVAGTIFTDLAADLQNTAPAAVLQQLPVFFGPSFMHAMAMTGKIPQTYHHSGKSARQLALEWNKATKHEHARIKVPGHPHVLGVPLPWK